MVKSIGMFLVCASKISPAFLDHSNDKSLLGSVHILRNQVGGEEGGLGFIENAYA